DGRSEEGALAALQRDGRVRSAQLNRRYFHTDEHDRRYRHTGEEQQRYERAEAAAIPQYAPRKLSLPEAHQLALGRHIAIAVIDSVIDATHPDLRGAVTRSLNVIARGDASPDFHGTAVAGIIRAHGLVEGAAPEADILAVRAFRTVGPNTPPETTTDVL